MQLFYAVILGKAKKRQNKPTKLKTEQTVCVVYCLYYERAHALTPLQEQKKTRKILNAQRSVS